MSVAPSSLSDPAQTQTRARQKLAYALDFPNLTEARRAAEAVAESVGVLKVGLELFVREGPPAARLGAEFDCRLFLDLKLCDIPQTVESAVAAAAALGIDYLTVHASGGFSMLEQAAKRAQKENPSLKLLAVTLLTSLDRSDLERLGISGSPSDQVLRLATLSREAGLSGLVCSVSELAALRQAFGSEMLFVTPGIRPETASAGDQKRTGTPGEAIRAGASLLVVGRPISQAADPPAAARRIVSEIAAAQDG